MAWIADIEGHRTFDPAAGLELRFRSITPLGVCDIEIVGESFDIRFKASSVDGSLSKSEIAALGAVKAGLWVVYSGDEFSPESQQIIAEALTATRFEHGCEIDRPFFVRFGRHGEIYGLCQSPSHQRCGIN